MELFDDCYISDLPLIESIIIEFASVLDDNNLEVTHVFKGFVLIGLTLALWGCVVIAFPKWLAHVAGDGHNVDRAVVLARFAAVDIDVFVLPIYALHAP